MHEPPDFSTKRIEQKINGNSNQQSAGNINNNYYLYPQQDSKMKELIEAYKQEQKTNSSFNEFIEDLDYYLNPVKSEEQNVIGLEKKLKDGQLEAYVEQAMRMKDLFWRKVERYRFSKVAQQIFLYVLADVLTLFNYKIYPFIRNDTAHEIIMNKINDEIINVLLQKLGENILDIYADSISGMIYFLTGNCHIKWNKL
jgi:hypothetical protein